MSAFLTLVNFSHKAPETPSKGLKILPAGLLLTAGILNDFLKILVWVSGILGMVYTIGGMGIGYTYTGIGSTYAGMLKPYYINVYLYHFSYTSCTNLYFLGYPAPFFYFCRKRKIPGPGILSLY